MGNLEKLSHAFISTFYSCNAFYFGVNQLLINRWSRMLLLACWRDLAGISRILSSLNLLPVYYRINFKGIVLAFKSLHGLASLYISDLLQPYFPKICSSPTLCGPTKKLKVRGDRTSPWQLLSFGRDCQLINWAIPFNYFFKSHLKTNYIFSWVFRLIVDSVFFPYF